MSEIEVIKNLPRRQRQRLYSLKIASSLPGISEFFDSAFALDTNGLTEGRVMSATFGTDYSLVFVGRKRRARVS